MPITFGQRLFMRSWVIRLRQSERTITLQPWRSKKVKLVYRAVTVPLFPFPVQFQSVFG